MKYFMLDIETLGLDHDKDDIIQIALVELTQGSDGYYWPGRVYERKLYTNQVVTDEWIRKTHFNLLGYCKLLPQHTDLEIRWDILNFFKNCGVDESNPAMLMGLNATTFDIPFMLNKGYLKKSDFHYRIYELKGAYNLAQDVLGLDSKELFESAIKSFPEIKLPAGTVHEALYDCYKQLRVLNGSIRLLRKSRVA